VLPPVNQIEIYFPIVQRKGIKPANFADLAALEQPLLGFQQRDNATPEPFDWAHPRPTSTTTAND